MNSECSLVSLTHNEAPEANWRAILASLFDQFRCYYDLFGSRSSNNSNDKRILERS